MDVDHKKITYDLVEDEFLPLNILNNWNLNGDDIQKLSVLQALPQLLQTEPQATFTRIIPKILQELPKSSCEFHVMTSKVFRILIERNLATGNLLYAVIQGVDSRDLIVSNAWMETLLAVITNLSELQVKNDIIPLANSKSLLSQPVAARVASCRILGRLAIHKCLKPVDVKRDILPLVQSLCQDCHPDVRTAMCIQLPHIAQGLSSESIKSDLLTSLVELASDDNMYVRSSAVGAIVEMFPHLTPEDNMEIILPLVKLLCEKSLKSADVTSITLARDLGKLIDGIQPSLSVHDGVWFLHCFKILSRRGLSYDMTDFRSTDASMDVICRQHCASNLPVIAHFALTTMPGQIEVLYGIFQELAADPCYIVRGTVAGCLHEVTKIFGPHSKMIKPDFVRLLRDDSEDVLLKLVPHMGKTLESLCLHGTLSRQTSNQATMEIGRAMLKCQYELASGYNWRLFTHFIHQLEHLPNCMPSDFIHQHFTPIVLTSAVDGRARPVRTQAARTLLVFLRFNRKELQRKWLKDSMITQLCRSSCSYTRHIYIRLCLNALDIFSERYFKEHFYESLLDLADDPVANVRLCVASMFTVLKQMLILPEDELLNVRLEELFVKYATKETDRDVVAVFQMKMKEMRNPRSKSEVEEHDKEQKRRIAEEEQIATLKSIRNPAAAATKKNLEKGKKNSNSGNNSYLEQASDNMLDSKLNGLNRSASVPRKRPNIDFHNDMSFLEQHFYIDAGVNLPSEPTPTASKTVTVDKLTKQFEQTLQIEPENSKIQLCNATDDDKVNLRQLCNPSRTNLGNPTSTNLSNETSTNLSNETSNNLGNPTSRKLGNQESRKLCNPTSRNRNEMKNKRYSSVISTNCLEKTQQNRKTINRRSLNIPIQETSKIPVSYSNKPKIKVKQNENNDPETNGMTKTTLTSDIKCSKVVELNNNKKDIHISSLKSPSHLPVLKRRSQSEARK